MSKVKSKDYSLSYKPGLKKDITIIIQQAKGQEKAIPRPVLVKMLKRWDDGDLDRKVRAAIRDLRLDGIPICSTGGTSGGYWYAEDWNDLMEFVNREYHSRAMSMLEVEKAMKAGARELWGPRQEKLF
jgi:hypothetical protein